MSKPSALLIGGVTHVEKEWQECASFANLRVSIHVELGYYLPSDKTRSSLERREQSSSKRSKMETTMMSLHYIEVTTRLQ